MCSCPANILASFNTAFPIRDVLHQHYFSHIQECSFPSKHTGPFQLSDHHQECSQPKMTLLPSPLARRARVKCSVLRGMIDKESGIKTEKTQTISVSSIAKVHKLFHRLLRKSTHYPSKCLYNPQIHTMPQTKGLSWFVHHTRGRKHCS